jgi:hypothetical protein
MLMMLGGKSGAAPTLPMDASLLFAIEPRAAYVNGAVNGGEIDTLTAVFPNSFNLTASGSGLKWDAAHSAIMLDGTNYFNTPSNLTIPAPPWTIYAITRSNTIGVYVFNYAQQTTFFRIGSSVHLEDIASNQFIDDVALPGVNQGQLFLLRVRARASDGEVFMAATGVPEFDIGASAATGNSVILNNVGGSATLNSDSDSLLGPLYITLADTVAGGLDAQYRAYMQSTFGVSM